MLAKHIPTIMPDMTEDETIETTQIHSISGMLDPKRAFLTTRPFRSPHHTISDAGLLGGGTHPGPGEVSLAHHGVRHTPPTALFLDAVSLFHAARDHMAGKGIVSPGDVSLICDDPDPTFEWMQPSVAHIQWSFDPLVRRIVRWLENVTCGRDDRRQTLPRAKFVDGGTIGPPPEILIRQPRPACRAK